MLLHIIPLLSIVYQDNQIFDNVNIDCYVITFEKQLP